MAKILSKRPIATEMSIGLRSSSLRIKAPNGWLFFLFTNTLTEKTDKINDLESKKFHCHKCFIDDSPCQSFLVKTNINYDDCVELS